MKKILIIGATSAIASACARLWAAEGAQLFLVGRDLNKLQTLAPDLCLRGATAAHVWQMDATDLATHAAMVAAGVQALGRFDIALIAHGTLPNQAACEQQAALIASEFAINTISVLSLLTLLAQQFEQQRCGVMGVITSVAGERGRASNYVYGSAKAAVSTFCEGLRARLFKAGVALTDIRPGFVATPMTADLALPALLVSHPKKVAGRIVSGLERKVEVLYAPAYWRFIMFIIRNIPRRIFKRMRL